MRQEEQIQPDTDNGRNSGRNHKFFVFIMRDEDLNPHDIGPADKEHSENHDGNGITRILEILS